MRLGAMNHPAKPLGQQVQAVASMGFDYLELAMDPPEAGWETLAGRPAHLRSLLDEAGLGLVVHLPTFVYPADLTASIRKASVVELQHAMDTAAVLEAEKVVLHPPAIVGMGREAPDLARQHGADSLHAVISHGLQLGLTICLENLFPSLGDFWLPEHFAPWLETYPDLRLTLDVGHAHLNRHGPSAEGFLDRFAGRLGHLHLSDNLGRHDEHMALGRGGIDFASLARRLHAAGYDATATLEVFEGDKALVRSRRRWLRWWTLAGQEEGPAG